MTTDTPAATGRRDLVLLSLVVAIVTVMTAAAAVTVTHRAAHRATPDAHAVAAALSTDSATSGRTYRTYQQAPHTPSAAGWEDTLPDTVSRLAITTRGARTTVTLTTHGHTCQISYRADAIGDDPLTGPDCST